MPFFSASCSSELVALGVKLALKLLALSVDLRAVAAVVLSSPTGGVPGGLLGPPSLSRGVCGRDEAFSEASWDSKSASISFSPMDFDDALPGLDGFVLADFFGLASIPWKSSSRLSSAAAGWVFLEAMMRWAKRKSGMRREELARGCSLEVGFVGFTCELLARTPRRSRNGWLQLAKWGYKLEYVRM